MKKALLTLLAASIHLGAAAQIPDPLPGTLQINCRDTDKNAMVCVVRNTSQEQGSICADIVKVCKGGEHVAQMCSSMMQPGSMEQKVVTGFDPKVKFLEKCYGSEIRNTVVQH